MEGFAEKVQQTDIDQNDVMHDAAARTAEDQATSYYLMGKNSFDFISAFCVSIILLIPVLLIILIIEMKDFGNPFYVQKRIGKDGEEISVWKFRSMIKGADDLEKMLTKEQLEEYRKEYKLKDDPRLLGYKKPGDGTKCFGAKLRRMSLDELPQIFINILIKRNMSVIGPRPLVKEELEKYYTPAEQKQLTSIKPGLTGYWQAYARNNSTYESGERQKMELHYIENMSVGLDVRILLKTVVAVIREDGAV